MSPSSPNTNYTSADGGGEFRKATQGVWDVLDRIGAAAMDVLSDFPIISDTAVRELKPGFHTYEG